MKKETLLQFAIMEFPLAIIFVLIAAHWWIQGFGIAFDTSIEITSKNIYIIYMINSIFPLSYFIAKVMVHD